MAAVPKEINEAFYRGELADGIAFRLNEPVVVSAGPNRGARAWIISILSIEPEPLYQVELESGTDAAVFQSQLARADAR